MSIRLLDLRGQALSQQAVRETVPRAALDIAQALDQIRPLVAAIRQRGIEEIHDISMRLDGFRADPLWVAQQEFDDALNNLDAGLRQAIEESIIRVRQASEAAMPSEAVTTFASGGQVSTRHVPVESVGLYVPGGKAVYPSSVVMNVVPAQVAGVERIVIATPGQKDFGGRPHPTVLATAKLLGVTRVLAIGGPAAIASFAFGLDQIDLEPVDLVTGPGNIYVAAAKRLLRGTIGIDSEAGTTEILVLADQSANAEFVALDLISQAEHDEAAAAVLVTDSEELANAVSEQLDELIATNEHSVRIATALAGQQSAIVLVSDLNAAIDFANAYATEHLEIVTSDNAAVLARIRHAGAVFIGDYSPVSLGDYIAGSNHVLPTGGTARFNAGLGVHTFLRAQQVIDYSKDALQQVAAKVEVFSNAEGLPAHGRAVTDRLN